jgi:hypothetical protein
MRFVSPHQPFGLRGRSASSVDSICGRPRVRGKGSHSRGFIDSPAVNMRYSVTKTPSSIVLSAFPKSGCPMPRRRALGVGVSLAAHFVNRTRTEPWRLHSCSSSKRVHCKCSGELAANNDVAVSRLCCNPILLSTSTTSERFCKVPLMSLYSKSFIVLGIADELRLEIRSSWR